MHIVDKGSMRRSAGGMKRWCEYEELRPEDEKYGMYRTRDGSNGVMDELFANLLMIH
jgi:hypothetical protein